METCLEWPAFGKTGAIPAPPSFWVTIARHTTVGKGLGISIIRAIGDRPLLLTLLRGRAD
jgi:hypothetical protein